MYSIYNMIEEIEKQIKNIETSADILVERGEFEDCLSAIDMYIDAQMALYKHANGASLSVNGAFESGNAMHAAWYRKLANKMAVAQSKIADPKLAVK